MSAKTRGPWPGPVSSAAARTAAAVARWCGAAVSRVKMADTGPGPANIQCPVLGVTLAQQLGPGPRLRVPARLGGGCEVWGC